jgi:hypothetical protein
MTALIRGELIKTVTTRTLLGYAATATVISVLGVLVAIFTADLNTVAEKQMAIAGIPILLLLFALVGAAGEYRHRTAAPAALVARDRGGLLAGRAAAYVLTGLAIAALGMVVTLAIGLPLLGSEPGTALGAGDVGVVVAGSLIAAALFAIMGVAVGTLLRNQIAGVVGVLILAFIVDPLLSAIDKSIEHYSPFGSAFAAAGAGSGEGLPWGWAALVLAAWTVPFVIAALVVDRRRDIA